MVKSKDDYERRKDDSRFAKFDELINPYNDRAFYLMSIASTFLVFMIILTGFPSFFGILPPDTVKYESGLNITYEHESRDFHIAFTNPNNDTSKLITQIKAPFDSESYTDPYMNLYNYETSVFPANITYAPANASTKFNHIVTVTLIKNTGNYTYIYQTVPSTENQYWDGTGKYLKTMNNIVNIT